MKCAACNGRGWVHGLAGLERVEVHHARRGDVLYVVATDTLRPLELGTPIRRGIFQRAASTPWPLVCEACGGRGTLTFYALGKRLDEHPRTLRRVVAQRSRATTHARVLTALRELELDPMLVRPTSSSIGCWWCSDASDAPSSAWFCSPKCEAEARESDGAFGTPPRPEPPESSMRLVLT